MVVYLESIEEQRETFLETNLNQRLSVKKEEGIIGPMDDWVGEMNVCI